MKRGMFKIIHDDVMIMMGLTNTTIKQRTIFSHISCNSLNVDNCDNKTVLLLPIEPLLLQIALWKQDAGQHITPSKGIKLSNLLIDRKPIRTRLQEFQSSIRAETTVVVSEKFCLKFVELNRES